MRVLILWQCLKFDIGSIFSRNEVRLVRLGGKEIDADTCFRNLTFFLTLILTTLVGLLLIIADGVDLESSLGLVASMINNAGLAFRMAGPFESCAFLSDFGKTISMILMLLGRLEFYCWFALLLPAFWRSR
jgi:trk system potassium uptake protein TrkH